MSRVRLVAATILLVGILALYFFLAQRSMPRHTFVTSAASVVDIEDSVVATGTIMASELISVGAQASGQIKSLKVGLGDHVNAGDLIAEVDSVTQRNTLRSAEATIDNLRAQRNAQLAMLKVAELAFARQKKMLAAQLTPKADYDSAEAVLDSARAQSEALNAQIAQSLTTLASAQANLDYTLISAPMDGTVVAVITRQGQTVNASLSTPTIVKLAKLDTMTVSVEISEADVIKVKPGQTVYFTVLGDPQKRYYAKLRTVEPAPASIRDDTGASSDSANKAIYYNALFDIDNAEGLLRIAMTAQVHVVLAAAKHVLTIPLAALGEKTNDRGYTVQVLGEDGRPERREINVGIDNNINVQVLSGLNVGERVIVGEAEDNASGSTGERVSAPAAAM